MPKNLMRAVGDKIPPASQYTCGQIAFMMQVAHRTAAKMIDNGVIKGYRMMTGPDARRRERRVMHEALVAFIETYPDYHFMLDRLEDYDPAVDFGKDYKKRWERKIRKRPRVKIREELDGSALASGLEFEEEPEASPSPAPR